MKLGISLKLVCYIGGAVMLSFIIASTIVLFSIRSMENTRAKEMLTTKNREYAAEVLVGFTEGIAVATSMRDMFEFAANNPEAKITRKHLLDNIDIMLDRHTGLLGVWYNFDPNSMWNDKLYIEDENPTGGFNYYIGFTGKNGEKEYQVTSYDEMYYEEYYIIPKDTKEMYITNPYIDDEIVAGGVFVSSVIFPIVKNDKSLGVVGIDFRVASFDSILKPINQNPNTYSILVAADGTVVVHKFPELVGKRVYPTLREAKADKVNAELSDSLLKHLVLDPALYASIKAGTEYSGNNFSTILGTKVLEHKGTITLGAGVNKMHWALITASSEDAVYAGARKVVRNLLLINLASMVVILSCTLVISLSIVGPIKEVVDKMVAIGNGNLTQRLNINRNDELGIMSKSFNCFAQNIQEIVNIIKEKSRSLTVSSCTLHDTSDKMSSEAHVANTGLSKAEEAVTELDSQTGLVASEMKKAQASITSVQTAIQDMTTTIGEIAQSSTKARNYTLDVSSSVASVADMMKELDSATKEINSVTELISDISSQTSLLALNATIESARAGEAGKGFAVVANEIKALAQQTGEATDNIRSKIDGIKVASNATIENTEKVIKSLGDVSSVVTNIVAAIEEQHATTKNIASNMWLVMDNIKTATEKAVSSSESCRIVRSNVILVGENTGNVETESKSVKENSLSLKQLAKQLNDLTDKFTTS